MVKEDASEASVGKIVDVEADEEVAPCVVASFRINFSKLQGSIACGRVCPACS